MLEVLGIAEYAVYLSAGLGVARLLLTAAEKISGVTDTNEDDQLVAEGKEILAKVRKVARLVGLKN